MKFDDFDAQITCEEFYTHDPEWDALELGPDPDLELDPDDDDHLLEDSGEWVVADFVTDQGLTADGYALLASMDSRGEFL